MWDPVDLNLTALHSSLTVQYDNGFRGGNTSRLAQQVTNTANWRLHGTLQAMELHTTAAHIAEQTSAQSQRNNSVGESPATAHLKLSNGHLLLLGCVH